MINCCHYNAYPLEWSYISLRISVVCDAKMKYHLPASVAFSFIYQDCWCKDDDARGIAIATVQPAVQRPPMMRSHSVIEPGGRYKVLIVVVRFRENLLSWP